ncbi:MAG TPA: phytoene desaturase [Gemmatimonas aurantiaca]|uniref:Phytoene dehydrogenase n=2 Tax=Gemmatimonas aurantiaca TaxID=173480 RepID=C1AB44_GEMAT|nr:phytoene desaturase [Gemmatimonas aurantiaca]BAH39450.1 phytoene dehydrogenase [Gemmatimonas aurantiaca T-27]HCT56079.1 phytoene desaturase [Gemmatimonas aurantiaca]
MRIVVIGSGFGGLAAAIRLQAQGHSVTIVEKLDQPGGRACVFHQDGFTFDAGPTIITAPWVLDELFALTGRHTADFVSLVRLDPFYNIRFEDGSVFRYNGDKDALREQVRMFAPGDEAGYLTFREKAAAIFDAGMPLIDQPFDTIGSMVKAVPALLRTRADRSVAAMANAYLADERLRQVFSFHPLLVGGNPFRASSMYALIHKLEQQWGVLFCMGGTGALVQGLVRAFEELGGTMRYEHEVADVPVVNGRATGVRCVNGVHLDADAVVCNGDVVQAYRTLIKPEHHPRTPARRLERMRHSMSLFVIYFGTNRQYDNIAHHEILMGPRYRELLEDIFERKILADDFSLYLHRPTATDPSLAPPGCDAWYVLSPVPHLGSGTDWERVSERYRDRIMGYLEERYLPGLSQHLVTERRVDPRYFEGTLNSYLGSAFGPEPVLTQSAWFRPHNRDRDIGNLYFCGAGTHPGAGLPGVISSGKIVAGMIGRS